MKKWKLGLALMAPEVHAEALYLGDGEGTLVEVTADQINAMTTILTVANKTGGALDKGSLVYIAGYDTTLGAPTVALADADDATKQASHVLTEDIANDATGEADRECTVTGIDTSGASAVGSIAYESATAGGFTWSAPTDADDQRRAIGVCVTKNATTGSLFFSLGGGIDIAAKYLNNLTPGTAAAAGAVVLDSNKDIAGIRNLGATNLVLGSTTISEAEVGVLDGVTPGTSAASKAVVLDGSGKLDTIDLTQLLLGGDAITASAAQINAISAIATTVANKTGGALAKGTLVYINGYDTGLDAPTVAKADADGAAAVAQLVLTAEIADNASGTAYWRGAVTGIDTSGAAGVGSVAYLDATTAGGFTWTAPTGADQVVQAVGVCATKDAVTGSMFFFPGARAVLKLASSGLQDDSITAAKTDTATPGTIEGEKIVVADSNMNIGIVKGTELHIGASGAEVQVNATPAEIDVLHSLAQGSVLRGGAAGVEALDAKTDAQILVGDGTDIASVALSGHVSLANTGATTVDDVSDDILDGSHAAEYVASGLTPCLPVLFKFSIDGGAAADDDFVVAEKVCVVDVWCIHTGGAGEGSDTITVKSAGNAITDAMDWSGADEAVVRAATIDDANAVIAAGGTLRVTTTDNDAGDDVGAGWVCVLAHRIA